MRFELGFTSPFYLMFLMLVALLTTRMVRPKFKQVTWLGASYLFYASWTPWFLLVLLGSSVCNFAWRRRLRQHPKSSILWSAIAFNVLLLGSFKYLDWILSLFRVDKPPLFHIIAPVGLSFFTFQAMSALIDAYRLSDETEPSLLEFLLYMAFWPTVLAGPVPRLGEMVSQFHRAEAPTANDLSVGVSRIALGLFMKVVLADTLAAGVPARSGVTAGFDRIGSPWSGTDVWFLAAGFGLQLFCDFGGYSHIAIGSARLIGIRVRENFHDPYLSTSLTEFWTRWHMSLSSWIRDYVFFPLAAMRREMWWRSLALVISMTLFGLWHGASLTFVLWGIYHGFLLVAHRLQRQLPLLRWISETVGYRASAPVFCTLVSRAATFALVSLGWVLFRARDLHQASEMFAAIGSFATYPRLSLSATFYVFVLAGMAGYFAYVGIRGRVLRLVAETHATGTLTSTELR